MKNKLLTIICMILLAVATASAIIVNEETSSVARIVGNAPIDMLRQMQRDEINLEHATSYSEENWVTNGILENEFRGNLVTNQKAQLKEYNSQYSFSQVESSFNNFKRNELFIISGEGEPGKITSSGTFGNNEITPNDIDSWRETFQDANPLFILNAEYAGTYLPKENTFVSKIARDSTTITSTSFSSNEFINSFLCNLWNDKTVGEAYMDARNFHYNGGSVSSNDNLIGLVLQSYALYGNPMQVINMNWKEEDREKIKKAYCKNDLENLAPDIEFLEQVGNYSKFRKHLVFEIPAYEVENYENYSLIKANNTFNNLEYGELVLPMAVRTTHFPLNTIITGFSVDNVRDYEDITADIPSYEEDFVERTCYEQNKSYEINFDQAYSANSQDFIATIHPLEILNCSEGKFRLYKKFNYSVEYIALSPVLIKNVNAPANVNINDVINVNAEIMPLTNQNVNGILAVYNNKNTKIWEREINSNDLVQEIQFYAPSEEGLQEYSLEFIYNNETVNYQQFSVNVRLLDVNAEIPAKASENQDINLKFNSYAGQIFSLDAKYYLFKGNTLKQEGNFSKSINLGENTYAIQLNNLKRSDQSYTLILELSYLGKKKTINYLITTNNMPLIYAYTDSNYKLNDDIIINYSAIDYDNDNLQVSINDTRFRKEGNSFIGKANNFGSYNVKLSVSDGLLNNEETISFEVEGNKAPVLEQVNDITTYENELINLSLYASDEENDNLVYFVNNTKFNKTDYNKFEWQTNKSDIGNYTIICGVSDGINTVVKSFNLNILSNNTVIKDCNKLNYNECSTSNLCVLWRDGDLCVNLSVIDNKNWQCSDLLDTSQCNKIASCEWVNSLNRCNIKAAGYCGNNKINHYEICDGTDLGGKTCQSLGYTNGILKCVVQCSSYDASQCTKASPKPAKVIEFMYGDVNQDGKVSGSDSSLILKYIRGRVGLNKNQIKAGDVDLNGKVDAMDAAFINGYISGEIETLPITDL